MFFEAQNLYKAWNSRTIDCSLSAAEGTVTALVGPSGSGKSTVLRLVAGLEQNGRRPDKKSPKISLGGNDITALPPGKRECGMVFQSPSLFLHMSVQDNVAYGLVCRGMKKAEAREKARTALSSMGLSGAALRKPGTLSGGEAQRVQLARTLIVCPRLVLLDEPFSALDAPLRKKLALETKRDLSAWGSTALLVTHDIAEARAMAGTMLFMKDGRIIWSGRPDDFDEALFDG